MIFSFPRDVFARPDRHFYQTYVVWSIYYILNDRKQKEINFSVKTCQYSAYINSVKTGTVFPGLKAKMGRDESGNVRYNLYHSQKR
jgi:hypothetical protein